MNQQKKDRRIKRTEKQLEEALIKLLKTKNINQISVRELADEADITRATFYIHYRDAYDMLTHLQEKILKNIINLINDTTGKDPKDFFFKLFSYLSSEVSHPEILFYNTSEGSAFKRIGKIIIDNYMLLWSEKTESGNQADYEYYRSYTVFGCIAVIERWILKGMTESPEYMTRLAISFLPHSRIITLK